MNWQQNVREIGPKLYRYFGASFNNETAADLTQETLVRLVRRYEEGAFDPAKGTLVMFAYGIARFVRLEAWKRQASDLPSLDPNDAEKIPAPESEPDPARLLRNYISELADPAREILLLLIDEDLTLAQIGEVTNLPLNTVKSHVHRAKQTLREKLRKDNA